MAGYAGGRIRRIKMLNFMTYDDVEIFPKKGLNLVVGLNGTGKSSIMCAICLGLAGKPQFTGRATQLSDFIKHGCQEAEIEIELESRKNNVVIRRKIKGEKCEWYINKSLANHNEVANTVKKFNIDTSNLCQFLPQEKVVEFSRMDKKQRLENMLQAIGEPHLFELFNELKELNKNVSELEQNVKKFQISKNSAEEENVRISDEVQKQENRSRLKGELADLNKRKKILAYKQVYDECQELKKAKEACEKKLADLRKDNHEANQKEEEIYTEHAKGSKKLQDLKSRRMELMNQLKIHSNELMNCNEQVEKEKIEYRNKLAEKEYQENKLLEVNTIIEGLGRQLAEERSKYPDYDEKRRQNSQALAELQSEISEIHRRMEIASADKNKEDYFVMKLKSELTLLQDEQNKKMENLKRRDRSTYQAACWLLENRNRFRHNVYLPIMLEISVRSSEYAKYIENVISFRDMIAFVCEDKSDCERLTDVLKNQMKLPVNIVMAPDAPMSNFVSPPLSREYCQCGLRYFIKDLFTAPEPVMRYLCACCGIHRIPVSTSAINANNIEFILQKYSLFFAENTRISGKRSRYGQKNLSIKQDFIAAQNLLIHHNDERQQGIEEKLRKSEAELEVKKRDLDEYKAHLYEKEKVQAKLRQEMKALQDWKRDIEALKNKHSNKQIFRKKILIVIDEEQEKEKITKRIRSINDHREKVLSAFNSLLKDFIQLQKDITKVIMNLNTLSKCLKMTKASNEEIHERVKEAEVEHQNAVRAFQEKKRLGKTLFAEINELGLDNVGNVDINPEELDQRINHVQAELNLNEDNEPVVAEYYSRKRKIEIIQQRIVSFQVDLDEVKQNIQEKKREWLEPLQKHIENINKKFSRYFKQLSCAGEISLDIPENPDDFTKYGLQIKLKFHDDVPFTELSQTHHSGGECSVAAIVFILSLQELTEVPFRCIDEINQGMDSVNERKIYQLIADSVGQDRCSQYFLLTPKLLDGLEYPDDVAVHIIFNSCFLNIKLDVKKHLKIAQSQLGSTD